MGISKQEKERQKRERLGEIKRNKETLGGYEMKIIEYNGWNNVLIEFQDKQKAKVQTSYDNFIRGVVKNPYHPNVYNVGYIGEGKYKSRGKDGKKTKVYNLWKNVLERCYDPYKLNKLPTYRDCYVCEEWLNFQNFAKWYEENYYECNNERMELDKDILFKGNKIYSPKTCIFVPHRINSLFTKSNKTRGKYPIGVSEHYNKKANWKRLEALCNTLDGQKRLGYFPLNRPFQAFTAYKQFKENYIKEVADEYKDLIPKELYEALYKYEVEIND